MTAQALERAIKAAEQEIDKVEMVLTNPATLRRMQAERVVRAVLMAVRDLPEGFEDVVYPGPCDHEFARDSYRDHIDAILGEGEGE